MAVGNIDPQEVTVFGQTEDLDIVLIAHFGWTVDFDLGHITNLSDRAENLLIECLRKQYGAG